MNNKDYIDKYRNDNLILGTNFFNDSGINIDSIVSPAKIDNRQLCSPTDFQGDTPHCAGFSIAQLLEAKIWKQTGIPVQLDASQIYAKAKEIDKSIGIEGTNLESVFKAAFKLLGISQRQIKTIMNDGSNKTIDRFKHLIHKHDFLVAGFMIDNKWYDCIDGNYLISETDSAGSIGGHAVLACGYDRTGVFIQNHWGKDWGAKGFAKISWQVFLREFAYAAYIENWSN